LPTSVGALVLLAKTSVRVVENISVSDGVPLVSVEVAHDTRHLAIVNNICAQVLVVEVEVLTHVDGLLGGDLVDLEDGCIRGR